MCVSFAVATVNGKRQPSLATKSVSHALALQPLPWQPCLCTRLFFFFCHCAFTRNGCWRGRDYNRGLHFLSLFINPGSLVPTVDVVLGTVQGLAQPLPPKSWTGLLASSSPSSIQVLCLQGQSLSPPQPPYEPMSHLFILCTCPVPFFLCLCNLHHTTCCLSSLTFEPRSHFAICGKYFQPALLQYMKKKTNKKTDKKLSVFVYTRVWATMSNTIKQKYIAFIIVLSSLTCSQRDEYTARCTAIIVSCNQTHCLICQCIRNVCGVKQSYSY